MRDMTRWLGDGGMALVGLLGASFEGFGDGEGGDGVRLGDGGWSRATWEPTAAACNPNGLVQAGAHAVVLDAAMSFAVNAGLDGRDRSRATLEIKTETMRPARAGDALVATGAVVSMARQVAWTEGTVRDGEGRTVSRATATFLLHREP
ncbi:MAG: PaaI family thioesterase [Acidimicrobiales bacterium]